MVNVRFKALHKVELIQIVEIKNSKKFRPSKYFLKNLEKNRSFSHQKKENFKVFFKIILKNCIYIYFFLQIIHKSAHGIYVSKNTR